MNFRFQTSDCSFQKAFSEIRSAKFFLSLTLCFLIFTAACGSIPNLENTDCEAARNTIREFYSIHFANDMKPSEEYLKLREKFLTGDLKNSLSSDSSGKNDYFTATDDYPKAFRVGACEAITPNRTVFSVLVFWKDDARTEQREIKVEAVKENDRWLINKIF